MSDVAVAVVGVLGGLLMGAALTLALFWLLGGEITITRIEDQDEGEDDA